MILTEQEIKEAVGFTTDQMTAYRRIESSVLERLKAQESVCWTNETELSYSQFKRPDGELTSGSFWAEYHEDCDIPLYTNPLPPADVVRDAERLDWLLINPDATVCSDGAYGPFHVWFRYSNRTTKPANTARAAIDAAMKEMK